MKGIKKLIIDVSKKAPKEILIQSISSILIIIVGRFLKDIIFFWGQYIFYFFSRAVYIILGILLCTILIVLRKKESLLNKRIILGIIIGIIAIGGTIIFFNSNTKTNTKYLNILYLSSQREIHIEDELINEINNHFKNDYYYPVVHIETLILPKYIEDNNLVEQYVQKKGNNYDLIIYLKCGKEIDSKSCFFANHIGGVGSLGVYSNILEKLKNDTDKINFEIVSIYNFIITKLSFIDEFNPDTHYFILKDGADFEKKFFSGIKESFKEPKDYTKEINNIDISMNSFLADYFYEKDPEKTLEYLLKNFELSPIINSSNLVEYVNLYELSRIESVIKNGPSGFFISNDENYINGAIVNNYDYYSLIQNEPINQLGGFLMDYPEYIEIIYSKYQHNPFIQFTLGMIYSELANIGIFEKKDFTKQQIEYEKKSIKLLKQFSKTYSGYYYLPFKIEYLETELNFALGEDIYKTWDKGALLMKKYDVMDENNEKILLLKQKYNYLLENSVEPRLNGMEKIEEDCRQEYKEGNDINICIKGSDIEKILIKIDEILKNNYEGKSEKEGIINFIQEYKKRNNV